MQRLYQGICVGLFILVAFSNAIAEPTSQPVTMTAMFPAAGAKDVCADTQLKLTFTGTPVIGKGKIEILDAADNSTVATIDPAAPPPVKTIGGLPNYSYYPVLIDGNQATLTLPAALAYNNTYYVKIDAGAFGDSFAAMSDPNAWRFTTKQSPPESGKARLTVAADGSGDFATVQGALDFIPDGNDTPVTVFIKTGTYNEIICFTNRNSVTLLGEDRKKTIIAYPNNDRFNHNSGGNPFAPDAGAPVAASFGRGAVYHRGMFLGHHVKDLTIANLTLHNTSPHGASQAEAIILNGSQDAHAILSNCDLYSFQDTLQINGQAYISNCYIEGDVDFMWGTGPCFFDNCHITTVRTGGYYTQIRNPPSNHGFVYKNCTLDGAPDVTANFLSRIQPTRFPSSEVVLIDCTMTDAVSETAWKLQQTTDPLNIHFWEYNPHHADGTPVDVSKRASFSKQLKLPEDKDDVDHYSDPTWVLGGKWTPQSR
jgi:pectin methylesterase-like acyl-CoA thioesterase